MHMPFTATLTRCELRALRDAASALIASDGDTLPAGAPLRTALAALPLPPYQADGNPCECLVCGEVRHGS